MAGLFAAGLGILVALVVDILSSRAGASRVVAYAVNFAAGFAASVGFVALFSSRGLAECGIAVMAYGVWWFTFINLVQALESSLRVRLLGELRDAGGRMPRILLEARYNDQALLDLRLKRLCGSGAVIDRNGRLYLASPGLSTLARTLRVLKKAIVGRTSEFEVPFK